jgi:hypothetical protein
MRLDTNPTFRAPAPLSADSCNGSVCQSNAVDVSTRQAFRETSPAFGYAQHEDNKWGHSPFAHVSSISKDKGFGALTPAANARTIFHERNMPETRMATTFLSKQ